MANKTYKAAIIPDHTISNFYGTNTELSDIKTLPDGYTPDSLNWITGTEKDMIFLRRGTALLGKTRQEGTGKITGLGVGTRIDGTQVPFFTYGRKIKYYDFATDDTYEAGSDVIPAAAVDDDFTIQPYQNLAGSFVYISSLNSSIYKIPVANPDSVVDQNPTYKGFLKFGQGAALLFNYKDSANNKDTTNLRRSWLDKARIGLYANVSGEAVGSAGSTHYTHTLAARTGKRTVFAVSISATVAAGTETFVDDYNGHLISNFGGTGTVNYATGEVEVTFSAVTTGAVTANYYWEDATDAQSGTANSGAPLDFGYTISGRKAGEGVLFTQFDGGGSLNAVVPLGNVFYSFHSFKTWQSTFDTLDTENTNLPFREKMGVSSPFSVFGGAQGIYYINNSNPNRPEVYQLQLYTGATAANIAAPVLISKALNLSSYRFDKAVVFEWGIYILLACQQVRNGVADEFNSRLFIYNKKSGVWDLLDYPVSRLAEYMGTLIAGDPLTNNVFTLFSGFDDDGQDIYNYWTSGATNHGVTGQKVHNRMVIDGVIQTAQKIKVSQSFDGGKWVEVGGYDTVENGVTVHHYAIEGTGSYVDTGKSIAVGSYVEGSKLVGGGSTVYANPFRKEFVVNSPRYEYVRTRFEAVGSGYVQINFYRYKDIRFKGIRSMPIRTQN